MQFIKQIQLNTCLCWIQLQAAYRKETNKRIDYKKEAEKQPTKQSATSYNHKLKVNTICSL